jgi:hypothetical protein
MPRVKTELLKAGMVAAGDVKNIDGTLLLHAGTTLTDRHLTILSAWGIRELQVQAQDETEVILGSLGSLPVEVQARWTAEARERFWQLDETEPIAMEVFHLMLQRRARRERIHQDLTA